MIQDKKKIQYNCGETDRQTELPECRGQMGNSENKNKQKKKKKQDIHTLLLNNSLS